jgi:hypothetical protein
MLLFIKKTFADNKTFAVQCQGATATVATLKKCVYDAEGIRPALQRLGFAGKSLCDDERELASYGIENESTIILATLSEPPEVQAVRAAQDAAVRQALELQREEKERQRLERQQLQQFEQQRLQREVEEVRQGNQNAQLSIWQALVQIDTFGVRFNGAT